MGVSEESGMRLILPERRRDARWWDCRQSAKQFKNSSTRPVNGLEQPALCRGRRNASGGSHKIREKKKRADIPKEGKEGKNETIRYNPTAQPEVVTHNETRHLDVDHDQFPEEKEINGSCTKKMNIAIVHACIYLQFHGNRNGSSSFIHSK